MNEPTIVAAQRELAEEVKFPDDSSGQIQLAWYSGAFCTSDYITEEKEGKQGYHYVIAQCFAELTMGVDDEKDSTVLFRHHPLWKQPTTPRQPSGSHSTNYELLRLIEKLLPIL